MRKAFLPCIVLLALIGFALQPSKGRPAVVDLSPLRGFPHRIGDLHSTSDNDAILAPGRQATDGSVGLERYYGDGAGRRFYVYIAPQTIGQHAPIMCYRYGGYAVLSESQQVLAGGPQLRFNKLVVQDAASNKISTCVYYWKTADGIFVPRPNRSLGMIAARWSDHQQGLLVEICSEDDRAATPETEEILASLVRTTFPTVSELYPHVFSATTKDGSGR